MKKWEYKIINPMGNAEEELNEYGTYGWELVHSHYAWGWTFLLKREVDSDG